MRPSLQLIRTSQSCRWCRTDAAAGLEALFTIGVLHIGCSSQGSYWWELATTLYFSASTLAVDRAYVLAISEDRRELGLDGSRTRTTYKRPNVGGIFATTKNARGTYNKAPKMGGRILSQQNKKLNHSIRSNNQGKLGWRERRSGWKDGIMLLRFMRREWQTCDFSGSWGSCQYLRYSLLDGSLPAFAREQSSCRDLRQCRQRLFPSTAKPDREIFDRARYVFDKAGCELGTDKAPRRSSEAFPPINLGPLAKLPLVPNRCSRCNVDACMGGGGAFLLWRNAPEQKW